MILDAIPKQSGESIKFRIYDEGRSLVCVLLMLRFGFRGVPPTKRKCVCTNSLHGPAGLGYTAARTAYKSMPFRV